MQAITSGLIFLAVNTFKDCNYVCDFRTVCNVWGALAWSQISNVVIGARDEKRGFYQQKFTIIPKQKL